MIIYDGPSLLDGEPIIVVAVPDYSKKVGTMLLTWILLRDVDPREAAYDGRDVSICGDCKYRAREIFPELDARMVSTVSAPDMLRDAGERACYVRPHREPYLVWEKFHDNEYPDMQTREPPTDRWRKCVNRHRMPVRLGSYGDPAAVPTSVWYDLISTADRWTGYTHMWSHPHVDKDLRDICMASVDTLEERDRAQAVGWRTFLVVPRVYDERMLEEEADDILCPASHLGGRRTTCDRCQLCSGNASKARSIWIPAHGPGKQFVEVENFNGS